MGGKDVSHCNDVDLQRSITLGNLNENLPALELVPRA